MYVIFSIVDILQNYGKVPRFITVRPKADVKVETDIAEWLDGDKVSRVSACRYIGKEELRMLLDVGI